MSAGLWLLAAAFGLIVALLIVAGVWRMFRWWLRRNSDPVRDLSSALGEHRRIMQEPPSVRRHDRTEWDECTDEPRPMPVAMGVRR